MRDLKLYEIMEQGVFETYYPRNFRGLKGTVDIHAHAGPGRADPVALAKEASRAGMKALLFKITSMPSAEVARLTNEIVSEWAEREGLEPAICYGGVVLNTFLGGINLDLVRLVAGQGGKAVWMPTMTSAYHIMRTRGISFEEAKTKGLYVLDGGRLIEPARDIVKFAADHDLILSFGHLSPHEIFALAEEANRLGFTKAVVDHPFASVVGLVPEDFPRLAGLGVTINFTYFELSPFAAIDPQEMVHWIKELGPDRVVLSSDSGPDVFPDALECLRLLMRTLSACGIEEAWVNKMASANGRRLLKLN